MLALNAYREKPRLPYNGLTIVLSSPSRFDTRQLLSGYAGSYFKECLSPVSTAACDLRTAADNDDFLPNTKVVLLLGETAMKKYISLEHSLNEQRGCPYQKGEVIFLASYFPQDCMDMKASYEKDFNKNRTDVEDGSESEEEGGDDHGDKSTSAKTKRSNYRFWLEADVTKAKRLLRSEIRQLFNTQCKFSDYYIYPPLKEVVELLRSTKDSNLYLDIETDSKLNLTCLGFEVSNGPVYTVPITRYDGTLGYDNLPHFFAALSLALQRNRVIIHNSMFDLFVLAAGYGVGFGKNIYDTMLAAHRINVEAEKSLGHCVSLYTYMPYHKSEGIFEPKSDAQDRQLWAYNAKDIYTMRLIHEAQKETASIEQVNKSIYPYLMMSLQGMRYDEENRATLVASNDRYMTQYLRVLKALIGYDFLPTSSKACVKYFHTHLKLPVIKRSNKTGAPSLDEKSLLKLAVKQEHPTIPLILEYRRLKKQSGSLGFVPWRKEDSYKVTDYNIKQELCQK